MKTTQIETHQLSWREMGSGRSILLLHGFCEDSRMWQAFMPFLADAGYRVVAPDLPGFGSSPAVDGLTLADMAYILARLTSKLELYRPVVIGHSMGGYIGLELLAQKELVLAGLSLFHSHPYADSEEKKQLRQKSIAFIGRHGLAPYLKEFFQGLFPPDFSRERPYVLEQLRLWASDYPPKGVQTALMAMAGRPDHQDTLRNTTVPIQFVLGMEDPILPREQLLAQTHLPATADIHLMAGIGHMGAQEAPAVCVRRLAAFASFCQTYTPQSR